jgi:hypothetical protein
VAQRLLDLARQQGAVVAEIAFERVAVDHDPVLPELAGEAVAKVLAVGMVLGAEIGDDDGDVLEQSLELDRQGVDRVRDQRLEIVRLILIHWPNVKQPPTGGSKMRDLEPKTTARPRVIRTAVAVLAIVAGGVVWSGCGSDDSTDASETAKQQIEEGASTAEEAIKEGTKEAEKGLEEAKKQIEEGKGSAKKGLEKGRKQAEEGLEEGLEQAEKGVEEAKEKAEEYLP